MIPLKVPCLGADGRTAERQFELDSFAKQQDVVAIVVMGFDIGYADGTVPELAVPEKTVPNGSRAW